MGIQISSPVRKLEITQQLQFLDAISLFVCAEVLLPSQLNVVM